MRKYQQLVLFVISIICIVLFLFYRHEYLKLRSVLSVLNFFGAVETSNSKCFIFSNNLTKDITSKYQFQEPRSVWSNLDKHYIYSSFWEEDPNGSYIRTIVIGPKTTFHNFNCRVWFEEGDIILSEEGTVKYEWDAHSLSFSNTTFKYVLKCMIPDKPIFSSPYGVLWGVTSETEQHMKIFSPIFYRPSGSLLDSTICILPDYSGLPKTQIVEFIAYYNFLGVNNFIIYDAGIQHSIFPFLESITGRNGLLDSVTVLKWNFPLINSNLERLSIKDDCLSRTFSKSKFVGIVSWKDYIVPRKNSLSKIFFVNKFVNLLNLSLKHWLCCDNLTGKNLTKNPGPQFLRYTQCIEQSNVKDLLFVNLKSYERGKDQIFDVSEDEAHVNQYISCNESVELKTNIVKIPEYFSDLKSHKLLNLWKSHVNRSNIFS